jgi:hypothetical protein
MKFGVIVAGFAAVAVSIVAAPFDARAQSDTPEAAPLTVNEFCFLPPAKLSDDAVAAFLANPAALLEEYRSGGLPLVNTVRGLAGSSAKAVPVLLQLAATANERQQTAIGAGLARAAVACSRSEPAYSAMIQEAVAGAQLAPVLLAFQTAINDVQTAAIAGGGGGSSGGGGGGAGGIGGGGAAGPGSAGMIGDDFVAQQPGDLDASRPVNSFTAGQDGSNPGVSPSG